MTKRSDKLELLAELEGFEDSIEMMEEYAMDSVCPGICMNDGCEYTAEYEPDNDEGWCELCGTNTVVSAFVLAGVM